MKRTTNVPVLFTTLIFAAILLAGCSLDDTHDLPDDEPEITTWVHDFMPGGDGAPGADWFDDDGYTAETSNGYWLSWGSIAAPYLFTGDFTAEFRFYLKYVSTDDDIYHFAFYLADPQWESFATRKYCSLSAYYTKFPLQHGDAYFELDQGQGTYTYDWHGGNVPGLTSGLNTCVIARDGDTVTITMNGASVGTISILESNRPQVGYAPFVYGHNSSVEAETNFYMRKITVTYLSGEVVYHNWNE